MSRSHVIPILVASLLVDQVADIMNCIGKVELILYDSIFCFNSKIHWFVQRTVVWKMSLL